MKNENALVLLQVLNDDTNTAIHKLANDPALLAFAQKFRASFFELDLEDRQILASVDAELARMGIENL
jgi:hypothetical protein